MFSEVRMFKGSIIFSLSLIMLIRCILQTPIHADTTIENGIKQFQQFINNNLLSAYFLMYVSV